MTEDLRQLDPAGHPRVYAVRSTFDSSVSDYEAYCAMLKLACDLEEELQRSKHGTGTD